MADIKITQYEPVVQNDLVDTTLMEVVNSGSGGTRDNYKASLSQLRTYFENRIVDGTIDLTTLTVEGNTILARDGGSVKIGASAPTISGSILTANGIVDITRSSAPVIRFNNTALSYTEPVQLRSPSDGVLGIANSGGGMLFQASAITSNILIGTTTDSGPRLVVADGVGSLPSITTSTVSVFQNNSLSTSNAYISIIGGSSNLAGINLGDSESERDCRIYYDNVLGNLSFWTRGAETMRLTSANHLLLNTTSDPGETLHVGSGGARFTGSVGSIVFSQFGYFIQMTRNGSNFIQAGTTAADTSASLSIFTAGQTSTPNVIFNADQSTTFNGTAASWTFDPLGRSLDHSYAGTNYIRGTDTIGKVGIITGNRARTDANANAIFSSDLSTTFNGTVYTPTGTVSTSDERLKENISDISNPLDKAIAIANTVKHFTYKEGVQSVNLPRTQYIAQLLEDNGFGSHVIERKPFNEVEGELLGWEYADEEYTRTETYTETEIQEDEEGNEVEVEVEKEREILETKRVVIKEGDLVKAVEQNFAPYAFPAIKALKEEIDLLKAEISALKGE